ncbi:class IIc cyclic bacteriocin [Clostridium sporogenes]|uniref:class IIc cyclic bacteriocin n=1 Tax=Clostridium sporogenes TaxID=1509 RepID=UPI003DA4A448
MKINVLKRHLMLNKVEKISFNAIATVGVFAVAACNITLISSLLGINLDSSAIDQISNLISSGTSLLDAFAKVIGITIPSWMISLLSSSSTIASA